MFVGITVNAVIVLQHLPRLLVIGGKRAAFGENKVQDLKDAGFYPNWWLNLQCFLIRLGMILTVLTAVLPDFVKGRFHGSTDLTFLHLVGIGLGILLALVGIVSYNVTALWTYCKHPKSFWKNPQLWLPHIFGVWTFWLTFTMVLGFGAANSNQTPYDSYCEPLH